jgi:molybdenum cofactor cytidylyltransferase
MPSVLVLASGRGERFLASGGTTHKLQADLCGKTVLQRTLDAVQQSGLPWHLEDAGHPGMGDSIAAAVRATKGSSQGGGWLILPADLPLIAPNTLLQIANADVDAEVLIPSYQWQRGHPVRFAAVCGDALAALQGEAGAAAVTQMFRKAMLPVDDPGCITDIDTVSDLQRAAALFTALFNAR